MPARPSSRSSAFTQRARQIVDDFASGERDLAHLEVELRAWLAGRGAKLPSGAPSVILAQHLLRVVHQATRELDEACAKLQGEIEQEAIALLLREARRARRSLGRTEARDAPKAARSPVPDSPPRQAATLAV